MSKPSELACNCAALFVLRTGSGQAAVPVAPEPAQRAARPADHAFDPFPEVIVTSVLHQVRLSNAPSSVPVAGAAGSAGSGTTCPYERPYGRLRPAHELHGPGVDFPLRRVARSPQLAVPGYHELDAWAAWQARPGVTPALADRHLLPVRHPERGTAGLRRPAERDAFAGAALCF
jgi:hypothetical protein